MPIGLNLPIWPAGSRSRPVMGNSQRRWEVTENPCYVVRPLTEKKATTPMGILDRLKPKPRWKHSSPDIRLQAIPGLGDAIELAALAEHDPDARVRTAALAKLVDPIVLGRLANSDTDQGVQDCAADRLLAVALDEANADAATAAGLLSDVRRVSVIAKSTAAEDVRAIALAVLTEERDLGDVARHAKVESTARAAAARLGAADELLATALSSQHREVALAAFDRVMAGGPTPDADVELLKHIEARTQHKAVARRAKTMLQAIEDADNARRAAEEEQQKQETVLCAAVESLNDIEDPDRIAENLARINVAWDRLASTDAAALRRFDAGADAARLRISLRRSEIAAALEEQRRRSQALGSREALCRRIKTLQGENALEQLSSMEEQWARLQPLVGYDREVEQLEAQFAAAAKGCRERLATATALEEARTALEARKTAAREAAERETAAREAEAKAIVDRATRLNRLVARAERAAESGTVTLREGERLLLDINTAVDHAAKGEATKEIREALAALRKSQDRIARRVKELHDLDAWRRFANGEQQEKLIAMAQAIVASLKAEEEAGTASDLAATAKALRELQAQWQTVADGPQQSARQSWDKFKLAIDYIRSRCEVYFDQVREERGKNLAAKVALVAQAEELVDSTDWSKTAAQFQELQKAWEESGPVSNGPTRSLAQRFRATCNTFFTRRRDALNSRKQEWNENLARKEALCERAEQLTESTEWDTAADELKKMQTEWKAIGPVRRDKSEVVWARFRSAADKFFERYHNRHKLAEAEQLAESEALVVALEGLAALEEEPGDLAAQVQTLRTTISNAPQLDGAAATALHERWMAALAALVSRSPAAFVGTDLDPVANHERMKRLIAKVESLIEEETPVEVTNKTATELLAEKLRSALANNALGVRPDETKWRAAGNAVGDAQDAWGRILPVPGEDTRALEKRFRAACKRVIDQVNVHVSPLRSPDEDFARNSPKARSGRSKRRGGRGPS